MLYKRDFKHFSSHYKEKAEETKMSDEEKWLKCQKQLDEKFLSLSSYKEDNSALQTKGDCYENEEIKKDLQRKKDLNKEIKKYNSNVSDCCLKSDWI